MQYGEFIFYNYNYIGEENWTNYLLGLVRGSAMLAIIDAKL